MYIYENLKKKEEIQMSEPITTYEKKPVDKLTFADDGMFQEVMRNPEISAELVERLLHIKSFVATTEVISCC